MFQNAPPLQGQYKPGVNGSGYAGTVLSMGRRL